MEAQEPDGRKSSGGLGILGFLAFCVGIYLILLSYSDDYRILLIGIVMVITGIGAVFTTAIRRGKRRPPYE